MSINIFLSSPRKGLEGIREAIIHELDKFNPFLNVIAMEKDEFWERYPSQKVSIENLKKSNIYILLIGDRYGTVIENCEIEDCPLRGRECTGGISYTHCEYRFAKAMKIPRLCLRLRIDKKDDMKEDEKDNKKKLEDFIKEVKKSDTPKYITAETPDEAIKKVVKEVRGILPKKIVEWYKNHELKIPMFFGRGEELSKIWNEFESGGVLYITGVGGIGKTSLAEVLLILKAIEGWRVWAVYRRGSYTGYKLFKKLAERNELKNEVIKRIILSSESLTYTELCEKLAGIRGRIDYDNLVDILDEKNVILLLDDLQFADDDVKTFVERCGKTLSKSAIIVTSRRFEGTKRVEVKGIEKDYDNYVRFLANEYSVSIDDSEIERIRKLSRGHPLLTEIIVRNRHRCKISKICEIPKTLSDDDFVNEFLKRLIEENIKGKSLDVLKTLSVFKRKVGKEILEILGVDEKIVRNLIDWMMLRKNYAFYNDVIKECVFGMLSEDEKLEAHKTAVRYYEGFYNKYIKERSKDLILMVFEYVYHLVECKEFEKAWEIIVDREMFKDLRGNINLEEFVRVLEKIHENIDGYKRDKIALIIGRIYDDIGQFNKTVKILESLEHIKGTDEIERYKLLSLAYTRISRTIDTLKNILKAVTITENEEDFKKCLWYYGVTNWYLSNFKVSIRFYNKSLGAYTHSGLVYHDIGDAYVRLGNLYESYKSFKKGFEKSKNELELAENSLGKGYVLTILGEYETAIEKLKNSEKVFLKMKHFFSPHSYVCMGIFHHMHEQLDDARKNYEDGLRTSTYDYIKAVALHNLGILYTDLDLKDLKKAESFLREAEKIFDRYGFTYGKAKVLHHLGVIEELRINFEKAEEYYKESLKLKEDLTRENREKIRKMIEEDPEFREIVEKAKERGIDVIKDFETRNVDRLGRAVTLAQLGVLKFKEGKNIDVIFRDFMIP
ncbi:tetratricopeptide repeat protein [Archaeoglobus sp.]